MKVFGHPGSSGGFLAGKQQVFPVDYKSDVSQRLLEASSSNDLKSALDFIDDPFIDVNFVGAVSLKVRMTEVLCPEESGNVVRFEYQELKTDVTALFVAVHNGNPTLVRKLLTHGADVNQKLFRGFSITAAVREGHLEIFKILLKAGPSQSACEEALLEASCHGRGGKFIELLMSSDLIRTHIATHALVTACSRGFTDVVDTLLKCGVDVNGSARVLLQSSKPSLHTNTDCTPLVAAVIMAIVRLLLQAGAKIDMKVDLGAWSWDMVSGDEFRVGAGLADPYPITWCAVEYFEKSGTILQLLLHHISPNTYHNGRTLLHHGVLCNNIGALKTLLKCGAHINSTITNSDDTSLMMCSKFKREECLRVLINADADLGLVNITGQSARSIAESNKWSHTFQQTVLRVIRSGKITVSSNTTVFSPLLFVAYSGDVEALKAILNEENINLNEQDNNGFSPVMMTVIEGHIDAFRLLVYAGADVKLTNKAGENAISLSKLNKNSDLFEKVMLQFTLKNGYKSFGGFYPLHYAARHGDTHAVKLLIDQGYDVNVPDTDGHTPLMLAAREGHVVMCELLILSKSLCDFENSKGETALTIARKHKENDVERVILDELARVLVLGGGGGVMKHTRGGKGAPHKKVLKMVGSEGVLRWGNARRRNVVCVEADVGPSPRFLKRRRRKGGADMAGVFRVVTMKNKEVHFVCKGGCEMAEMWVRGIRLVTTEALSGRLRMTY